MQRSECHSIHRFLDQDGFWKNLPAGNIPNGNQFHKWCDKRGEKKGLVVKLHFSIAIFTVDFGEHFCIGEVREHDAIVLLVSSVENKLLECFISLANTKLFEL